MNLDLDRNEQDLLGSILQTDGFESEIQNAKSQNNSSFKSDSILEYEGQYFEALSKSFENLSFGSDFGCSPTSPNGPILMDCSLNSQDGCSFMNTTVEYPYKSKYCGYRSPGHMPYPKSRIQSFQEQQLKSINEINEDLLLSQDIENMCGNQILSRKVQKIFETGRPEQKELIFNKIERSGIQFSKDVFGNYLVQRIFERGTQQQQIKLFNKLRSHFYELAKHNFGCRVIQKITEIVTAEMQNSLVEAIKIQSKSLLFDSSGNYVILKCLECIPPEKMKFVIPPIEESVPFMIQQTYGCKIIFKVLELYPNETNQILLTALKNVNYLVNQEYGNYIIQLSLTKNLYDKSLSDFILANLEYLSTNKYASNTVERLIDVADQVQLQELTKIFCQTSPNGNYVFVNICINPFGNYVIKKYLIVCPRHITQQILEELKKDSRNLSQIISSQFGQRVYQIIQKIA